MKFVAATASSFVPASHEDPKSPGVLKRVIATDKVLQAGQVRMLNWASLPVGSSFRSHYHQDMQEVFVLLSGQVIMNVDGHAVAMSPGDTVIVEPAEVHSMRNDSDVPAEYIVFGISSGEGGETVVV